MDTELKHDAVLHVAAGGLGITAPGCPKCEADGGYVSPARPRGVAHDHREHVIGCFRCELSRDELG